MLSLIAKANQEQIAQFIMIILLCRQKFVIEPVVKKKLTIALSVMVSFCCFAMEIMLNPYRYGTTKDIQEAWIGLCVSIPYRYGTTKWQFLWAM